MKYTIKAEYFGVAEDFETDYDQRYERVFSGETLKEAFAEYLSFIVWEYTKGERKDRYRELFVFDISNAEEGEN